MIYTATGIIHSIKSTQTFAKGFKKREMVLITDPEAKYPKEVPFQAVRDNCDLLDKFRTREKVEVEFVLDGREWNGRHFCNLEITSILSLDKRDGVEPEPSPKDEPAADTSAPDDYDESEIPF